MQHTYVQLLGDETCIVCSKAFLPGTHSRFSLPAHLLTKPESQDEFLRLLQIGQLELEMELAEAPKFWCPEEQEDGRICRSCYENHLEQVKLFYEKQMKELLCLATEPKSPT